MPRVAVQTAPTGQMYKVTRRARQRAGGMNSNASVAQPITMAGAISGGARRDSTLRVCRRRELIQTVTGSSAFASVIQLPINPGLAQMFLWTSKEARQFEKYRFRRLAFEYENSVGPADATNAGGNLAMMVDFDALDSAPVTMQALAQNHVNSIFSPYEKVRLEVPQAELVKIGWLYTRLGGVPTGADQKTYDMGQFILAASGTSTNGLGLLFVDYEVELDEPQEAPILCQRIAATAGMSASALVGSDAANATGSIPMWTLTSASTLTCAIAGDYLMDIGITGTVLTDVNAVGGTATSTIAAASSAVDAAAVNTVATILVRASVGQTVAPTLTSATTVTAVSWRIAPWNYTVL